MQEPKQPVDEAQRLEALRALSILDTLPEERFDRLTRLAKRLFGVPIALVSLVDDHRQWFKSRQGLEASETPRDISFCGHAVLGDDIFLVPDASKDDRFFDNPLVTDDPHIRFYAGCPLTLPGGSRPGTLCLIDRQPRQLSPDDLDLLRDLARMVEEELVAVQLATMDDLTHLSNRRGFQALGLHALQLCRRVERPAALLYFDLDGFKAINDRFGHAEGDRALNVFAQLLQQTFRDSDVLGRLGGDEFAVLATDSTAADLRQVLSRLDAAVDRQNAAERRGYDLRYSVGAVDFDPRQHPDIDALTAAADALMYAQKQARRRVANTG